MLAFILRRLLLMIPTTFGVAFVIFALYHAAPGDPATVMMGLGSGGNLSTGSDTGARVEAFRREFGLDRNVVVQFVNYMGPFNLLRDGHPWFSSPYRERKTSKTKLEGGGSAVTGTVLPIGHLPSLSAEERGAIDAAVAALLAGDGENANEVAEFGKDALPALLTSLGSLERARGARVADQVRSLHEVLALVTGHTAEVPVAFDSGPERTLLIEHWFGWYYTEGGGARVQNSGARPWAGLLAWDLGKEMQSKKPVKDELARRLLVTVPLAMASVLISYLLALPLGIFSARRQGTRTDVAMTTSLFVLYSVPTFWAGLMLALLFGKTNLDLLPVIGLHHKDAHAFGPWQYAWDTVLHCILPVATMSFGALAYLSRQMRAGMLDVIRQDYIRTARAKGLSENVVIYKHALRNSMIPVITLLASILPILVGGSIIVEKVFDLPGMGLYAFDGLLKRDFYIIMATTIFVGLMTQIGILLSDITYSLVDPRIRQS